MNLKQISIYFFGFLCIFYFIGASLLYLLYGVSTFLRFILIYTTLVFLTDKLEIIEEKINHEYNYQPKQ